MTPLERLMYIQGQKCFFCQKVIPENEASVEHLVASSKGGANSEDNCVACCKSLNTLLGSRPLKEKLRILLDQKGRFKCPVTKTSDSPAKVKSVKVKAVKVKSVKVISEPKETLKITGTTLAVVPDISLDDKLATVVDFLSKHDSNRPGKLQALCNAVTTRFKKLLEENERVAILEQLRARGYIMVENGKVTYQLPCKSDKKPAKTTQPKSAKKSTLF
ncbi:MAG: endonuclease family protein [Planctomycetaceae bacterium]|nr:endonuclease family protein [Planctomycetaceae bacterium]